MLMHAYIQIRHPCTSPSKIPGYGPVYVCHMLVATIEHLQETITTLSHTDPHTVETPTSASNDQMGGYSILFEFFELENIANRAITKAELLLFQDSPVPYRHVPYLHIIVKAPTHGPTLIVNTIHDGLEQSGYKTYDITPIIAIWLKGGSNGPLVLEVSAHCVDSPDCGKHIFDGGLGEKSPKLVVSREVAENTSQQRLKRQVEKISSNKTDDEYSGFNKTLKSNETSHNGSETTCSLHSLTIHFQKDLGFDFILHPESFNTGYCLGTCVPRSSPTVYQLYYRLGPNSPASSIEPHCAIHSTQDLSVIMKVDSSTFVIEQLKGVVVTSCGCA